MGAFIALVRSLKDSGVDLSTLSDHLLQAEEQIAPDFPETARMLDVLRQQLGES